MKQQLNRLKCAALAALTMGLALGAGAEDVAEVTIGSTTTQYGDMATAWAACANDDATLKLLRDVSIASELNKTTSKALLLDLDGHTLKRTGCGRVIAFPDGGAGDNLTIQNGVLTTDDETVPGNGGCICLRNYASLSLYDVTITNCAAAGDGGAIFSGTNSTLILDGCTLRYNQAGGKGGAICVPGGLACTNLMDKCLLRNTVITDNRAETGGAGVYFKQAERATYTIKYDSNGGTWTPADQVVNVGERWTSASAPTKSSATFIGWIDSGNRTSPTYKADTSYDSLTDKAGTNITLVASWTECLAAGTLITMADGSVKAIENVAEGDVVKTFDHEGGTNSTARVYYAFKGETKATPFVLQFDAEQVVGADPRAARTLSIVGCHDLLEKGSRKYVTITAANVGQYIGAKFYGEDGTWHTLTNATMGAEAVEYYSLYTAQHQNVYADGLLTVSDDVDYLLNIYELDDNLKADAVQLAADFAQYGEFSYEEAATYGVSREWYDAVGIRYMNIAIGKQLVSREYAERLFASTGKAAEPKVAESGAAGVRALPMMATASSGAPLSADDVSVGVLTLGEGVIVTNNFASKIESNILLGADGNDANSRSIIKLAENHDGICAGVGVAVSGMSFIGGRFTEKGGLTANDAELFSSDGPAFSVRYSSEVGWLEFVGGLQVGDNTWAHVTNGVCKIRGTGAMWDSYSTSAGLLANYKADIRSVIIGNNITGIGNYVFQKCYSLTNVTCGVGIKSVGVGAFARCYALERLTFAGEKPATIGDKAFAIRAGIRVEGGEAKVWPVPEVTYNSVAPTLYGKTNLVESAWTEVDDSNRQGMRFFTYNPTAK